MPSRRPLLGLDLASALALTTRNSASWTPDFTAGAAGLELETILNRFHMGFRATALTSGALKLIARPEDIRSCPSAWGALGLEVADAAYVWHRTRTWKSLLDPWVSSVDSIVGVAAVSLGSRCMLLQPQLDGTAWSNRMLTVRMAAVPLGDRSVVQQLAGAGIQLVPHLAWQPAGSRRRILALQATPLASALGQAYVISNRMRHKARKIDGRALRWAGEELDAALAAEDAAYLEAVLAPAPRVLADISARLVVDRPTAVALAAAEERRIRDWLAAGTPIDLTPEDRTEQMEVVEAGVRRLSRRLQGGVRLASSIADVIEIGRRTHHRPGIARWAQAAVAARGIVGAALAFEVLPNVLGERRAQRLVSATDVLTVAATGVHQLAERRDRSTAGWVERLVYEVSGTSGAARGDAPELNGVLGAISLLRAAVAWADHSSGNRPVHQRLAAVANEVVIVQSTARQVRQVFRTSLDQARQLTAATLNLDDHWTELDDLRIRHRAFVHDGLAQVLAAVIGGEIDDRTLRGWLDRERVRIDARLGRTTVGHAGDLAATVATLVDELAERGVEFIADASGLPTWTASIGGTVGEIVREAVNNTVKHTTSRAAWCGILEQDDGSVLVRICDYNTEYPVFRPGSGTGTATMISLARLVGADIEWFQTTSGGTEVRMVLHRPADHGPRAPGDL